MIRPPQRLAPKCSYSYQRHAWPRHQRRLPRRINEQRTCTHAKCRVVQTARDAPPRAHSKFLWYFRSRL